MRTLHLFAGHGGGLYADLILGHTPVCAVELDPYACSVLRARSADGWFPDMHVHEGDVRLFDPSPWAGRVDCVDAGFPCTDISAAGRGAGIRDGERSGLWSEVVRVATVVRPRWLMLENSPRITRRGLDIVLGDQAALGYDANWRVLGAADVGAPHQRDRWWCLARDARTGVSDRSSADSDSAGVQRLTGEPGAEKAQARARERERDPFLLVASTSLSDPNNQGSGRRIAQQGRGEGSRDVVGWWNAEPDVGRVAHGVAARRHRLHGLGNGQVPLAAATAWRLLGGPMIEQKSDGGGGGR